MGNKDKEWTWVAEKKLPEGKGVALSFEESWYLLSAY